MYVDVIDYPYSIKCISLDNKNYIIFTKRPNMEENKI